MFGNRVQGLQINEEGVLHAKQRAEQIQERNGGSIELICRLVDRPYCPYRFPALSIPG